MKNITKRIMALLASAVTAVTTLSANYSEVFAETTQETAVSSADSDYEVKSGGLLGNLMPDEFKSLAEENEEKENSDYAVYKLEYDNDMKNIIISYSAKQDCKIFIGFYNDEGTQLYTSVTADVPEGTNAQMAVERPDSLPDYYLIKAFMVGQFNNPVSKSCTYDKCTKAIQDILSKTIDDLEEECKEGKVIQFSENDKESFIVTKDEYVTIYSDDTKDTFIEQREDDKYVFKNYDKVKNLSEGQTVLVHTPKEMLLFVVDTIDIQNGELIITKKPVNLEDIVSLIRFDTDNYANEPVVECNVKKDSIFEDYEILDYNSSNKKENGISRSPAPNFEKQLPTVSKRIVFNLPKRYELPENTTESTELKLEVGGFVEVGVELDMSVYYSDEVCSVRGTFDEYFKIGIEGEASINQDLAKIEIYLFPISFSVTLQLHLRVKGEANFTISKTYDIEVIDNEVNCTPRKTEPSLNGEVTLEITLGLDIGINFLSSHVLHIGIEPEFGIKFLFSDSSKENNDYTHHDCVNCYSWTKSNFFRISFYLSVMGIEVWREKGADDKIGYESEREIDKSEILHWSNGNWLLGPCENISHKIIIHVEEESRDSNGELITKPSGKATLYSGKYVVDDLKFKDKEEKDILTNDDGEVELWIKDKLLTDEDYCITIKTADNKVGMVRVGESWNPILNKANEFNVVIKEDAVTVDPDGGLEYPKRGNCGVKRTTLLGEIKYDRVEYYYWADGICEIQGTGTLDGGKLSSDLEKLGVKTLDKLVIYGGVNLADDETATYINREIKIKEIDFYGCHNGTLVSTFGSRNELKKVDLSWFDRIGDSAFLGCQGLETILWYDSLKEIGKKAFMGNSSLKKIVFPETLKTIDDEAFNWSGLNEITLNNGLETIGISAFRNTALKSINIPASVKKLGLEAFCDCKSLKTVIINGDFETDGVPFYNSPVTTLVINDGVTAICERLMQNSTTLNHVRFSKQLEKIGAYAFEGTGLKYIILPGSLKIVEEGAFRNSNLKSVVIPENVISIGDEAFEGNPITKLELPDSLESIGRCAFAQTQLDSVIVPENVNFIGMGAFFNGNIINGIGSENDQDKALTTITVRNPECELGTNFVSNKTKIYGYTGSTAEAYAKEYGNPFKALDTPAVTTTAATTTTTTTTTAAVVTTQIAPDSECVFIAVKDKDTAGASSDKVFADGNVKYFDQQTADANGVVSFSYLPDEKEKWAFIFVSQVINDTITKTFGTADDLKTTTYNVAPGVKGDANGDGEIDMSDVVLIMQALANPNKYGIEGTDPKHISENGFKYADSDGDGLTVNDALRIQQYLLGIIPALT